MQIGIIGINHFSSSLALREKIAKVCRLDLLHRCLKQKIPHVLLLTCNRSELYFSSPDLAETHSEILNLLRESMDEPFDQALYSYFGGDCFLHLGRVISGMDSMIFGESDIQRQVKLAYESSRQKQKLTPSLHYLFQKGLKVGKQMRTAVLPEQGRLPHAVDSLIDCLHKQASSKKFLFIGNSVINRGMISHFSRKGYESLTLCTRTKNQVFPHVQLQGWNAIDSWQEYDVVIAGTYHEGYICQPSSALDQVKKPIALFDLGVPRNIDPQLIRHPFLHLYNIDALSQMVSQKKKTSEKEIHLCETMIEKVVDRQIELFHQKQQARWRYVAPCEKLAVLP